LKRFNKYFDFSVCTKDALKFSCRSFKINQITVDKTALINENKALQSFQDLKTKLRKLKERVPLIIIALAIIFDCQVIYSKKVYKKNNGITRSTNQT